MAYGDITSIPDSEIFESTWCPSQKVILVGPGVVAIFYNGNNSTHPQGVVKTYPIDASGNVGALIDSWTYIPSDYNGARPHPIHVANDIYAVAYQGYVGSAKVRVSTIQIAADGTITKSLIGTLDMYAASNVQPHIARLPETNTYVVVSHITGNDGYMATININEDGTGLANIDGWEYDPVFGYFAYVAHARGNYFMMAHSGEVVTIYVANDGTITKSLASSISDAGIYMPRILPLSDNIFVVFSDAVVNTYSVSAAGALSALGSHTYHAGALGSGVARIGAFGGLNYFMVHYHLAGYVGYITTLSINDAGDTFANIDSYNSGGPPPYIVGSNASFVQGNIYAITYNNSDGTAGTLFTAEIETPPTAVPVPKKNLAHELVQGSLI